MNVLNPDSIIKKLEYELETLNNTLTEKKVIAEKAIGLCQLAFFELKSYVKEKGFCCIEDEIMFFRNIKPIVFSKLIFFNELRKIEMYKHLIHRKFAIKMLKNEFSKITEFIQSNREFYEYYITYQSCLDKTYFVRDNSLTVSNSGNISFLADPQFSTMKDETVSYILAYEQLGKYLENEIEELKKGHNRDQNKAVNSRPLKPKIIWTAPKAALIELIYALHSNNCINNGRVDIKELLGCFEMLFDISLNNSYRVFIDIKERQKEKAKFLVELKRAFIRRLDDIEAIS